MDKKKEDVININIQLSVDVLNELLKAARKNKDKTVTFDAQFEEWESEEDETAYHTLEELIAGESTDYLINKICLDVLIKYKYAPIHPCQILLEEFINPLKKANKTKQQFCEEVGITTTDLHNIFNNCAMSSFVIEKISKYFKTTPEFWINLQDAYDRKIEGRK